jgi:hypothetical protein
MKKIAVMLIAAMLLMFNVGSASATLAVGWNFIRPYNCFGYQSGPVGYLYIITTAGNQISTADPTTISALAPLCATGHGFYIYWTGSGWTLYSIYPSIP